MKDNIKKKVISEKKKIEKWASPRKSLYRGKEMVPHPIINNCGLSCYITIVNILSLFQQPTLQLVDDGTCGIIPVPLYKGFSGWMSSLLRASRIISA